MTTASQTARPFTIVVGVDYSELGDQAFAHALSTAALHEHASIHVLHVIGASADGSHLGTAQDSERLRVHVELMLAGYSQSRPDGGSPPCERLTTHVGLDGAAEAIGQLATDVEANLVIVGTHGRRGVKRLLLGSVAEATVRLAPCPVLVVRPQGAAAETTIPEIEPACEQCLETRQATDGETFWCDQHQEQQERRHTYHFDSDRPSHQSGLLIPL